MEKEKIISFVKNHKKIFIPLGIILLIILTIIIYIGSTLPINIHREANYLSTNQMGGMAKAVRGYDGEINDEMVDSYVTSPTIPSFENTAGEYNKNIERKVIKNGNLSLVVKNMETAKNEIEKITSEFKGFVQNRNFSQNEYKRYGNQYSDVRSTVSRSGYYEVKIPVENFSPAYEKFRAIALKVTSDSVSGRDVTEEYLDLETRIKNKKAEESQYREILKTAKKVEDVLKVTQYINNTRNEIERLTGRINYLKNQVSLSTITINLIAEKDVEVFGVVWSPLQEIKAGFQSFLQDMINFADNIISFIFKLPVYLLYLLVWILGLGIIWKLFKKIKNKFWKKKKKIIEDINNNN